MGRNPLPLHMLTAVHRRERRTIMEVHNFRPRVLDFASLTCCSARKDMKRFVINAFVAIGVSTALVSTTGCYSVLSMSKVPPQAGAISPSRTQQRLAPAYLTSIQVSLNGAAQNLNPTFETRFVGALQEARVFSDVVSILGRERRPPNEDHFDLVLHGEEIQHPHTFGNVLKAIPIGGSLFLLSPAFPLVYGHEMKMTLSVTSPDRQVTKEYVAEAEGTIYFTMDKTQEAIPKLAGQVAQNAMSSVINQLTQDRSLELGGRH
jgi:hypothetical protein